MYTLTSFSALTLLVGWQEWMQNMHGKIPQAHICETWRDVGWLVGWLEFNGAFNTM